MLRVGGEHDERVPHSAALRHACQDKGFATEPAWQTCAFDFDSSSLPHGMNENVAENMQDSTDPTYILRLADKLNAIDHWQHSFLRALWAQLIFQINPDPRQSFGARSFSIPIPLLLSYSLVSPSLSLSHCISLSLSLTHVIHKPTHTHSPRSPANQTPRGLRKAAMVGEPPSSARPTPSASAPSSGQTAFSPRLAPHQPGTNEIAKQTLHIGAGTPRGW